MPDSKQLREELDWVTAKLSSQTWILNLGLLGTTWSLIMSVHSQARLTFAEARPTLVACIIGLTFDVIQYLSAFWLISQTRKALRASWEEQHRLRRPLVALHPATRVLRDQDSGHAGRGRLAARGPISQARLGRRDDCAGAQGTETPEAGEDWGVPRRAGRVARKSKAAEIFYMARKYGVSADEVRKVIKRVGRNRCRVEKAPEAERRRASSPRRPRRASPSAPARRSDRAEWPPTARQVLMSALPPKADMCCAARDVR